jgi:hypothetical protein
MKKQEICHIKRAQKLPDQVREIVFLPKWQTAIQIPHTWPLQRSK